MHQGMVVLKKTADALNDITPSLDRVVHEEAHTVLAVGDEIYTPANGRGGGPIRVPNPLESMVEGADFIGIVAKGPDSVRIVPFVDHWSPERSRGSAGASK